MKDTLTVKIQQVEKGFYSTGSGSESVLIEGSCRIIPYLNYLDYLNGDNKFTINVINIVEFHFDKNGNRIDVESSTQRYESDPSVLQMIKGVKYFVHEPCVNFGMFNTVPMTAKNIYQFGMNPEFDIVLPAFEPFILFQDYLNFDQEAKSKAKSDIASQGKLSPELQEVIVAKGNDSLGRFLKSCHITSFPEFADTFEKNWKLERWFWTNNHVSNRFTAELFRLMNDKAFMMDIPQQFWDRIKSEDMYSSNPVPLTQYDVDNYGIKWHEPIKAIST